MPKFSILIPIIKSKFLSTAIESVLSQSFSDWELILYNDCSPEDIEAVTKKFKDGRMRYYKGEKNLGADDPSKTWNKMLELANGRFICLLGDDDYISENYLEEIDKLIEKYTEADLFRTSLKKVNENNETILSGEMLPEFETWDQMMYQRNARNRLQCTTGFVLRKNALLEIGGYVNFPRACGSDDATYLLLAKNNGVVSTNKAFGYWRKSSLNISDNDSDETNRQKIRFYLAWEKKFLDDNFSLKVPASSLYEAIEEKFNWAMQREKVVENKENIKKCSRYSICIFKNNISFRSKNIIRKYWHAFTNCPLRQPARKMYYAARGKKLK